MIIYMNLGNLHVLTDLKPTNNIEIIPKGI